MTSAFILTKGLALCVIALALSRNELSDISKVFFIVPPTPSCPHAQRGVYSKGSQKACTLCSQKETLYDQERCTKTSASVKSTVAQHHENLTHTDWLTVFKFIDDHPGIKQTQVVRHFKTRKEGALIFTQPTLSRKLEQRTELKSCGDSNPNALSSKRPRIVIRPNVERALYR